MTSNPANIILNGSTRLITALGKG